MGLGDAAFIRIDARYDGVTCPVLALFLLAFVFGYIFLIGDRMTPLRIAVSSARAVSGVLRQQVSGGEMMARIPRHLLSGPRIRHPRKKTLRTMMTTFATGGAPIKQSSVVKAGLEEQEGMVLSRTSRRGWKVTT